MVDRGAGEGDADVGMPAGLDRRQPEPGLAAPADDVDDPGRSRW